MLQKTAKIEHGRGGNGADDENYECRLYSLQILVRRQKWKEGRGYSRNILTSEEGKRILRKLTISIVDYRRRKRDEGKYKGSKKKNWKLKHCSAVELR